MTEIEKSIILSFAENNMNAAETARIAHYHRNNIIYHLERIKKKYGLDPRKFCDLVELVKMAKGDKDGLD